MLADHTESRLEYAVETISESDLIIIQIDNIVPSGFLKYCWVLKIFLDLYRFVALSMCMMIQAEWSGHLFISLFFLNFYLIIYSSRDLQVHRVLLQFV